MSFAVSLSSAFAAPPIASKATLGGPKVLVPAELQVDVASTPRSDLESALITDAAVRDCLRQALKNAGNDFSVTSSGQVSAEGQISNVQSETYQPPPLKSCMEEAIAKVRLKTPGNPGSFSLTISRLRVTGVKAKTFMLDLNEPQKMQ